MSILSAPAPALPSIGETPLVTQAMIEISGVKLPVSVVHSRSRLDILSEGGLTVNQVQFPAECMFFVLMPGPMNEAMRAQMKPLPSNGKH